ncbi:MAG TPA: oxygen-independent coproporphyrinogen III oxidase [Burkholderiales bacterium]|nr:oxygen-independent coproporphyrinogen III oxidase [Burkholderiales bacterium]
MNAQDLVLDAELLSRFDKPGPRYTSYPTADRFVSAYDAEAHRATLEGLRLRGKRRALSLYVHLPFCNTVCYYCACNKVVTRDHSRAAKYLHYLSREMALVTDLIGKGRPIEQLHWGGGTPTFLSNAEIRELSASLRAHFNFTPGGEYSIEIDPRTVDAEKMKVLGECGFNRISVGVQDFDPAVQAAVNRQQSFAVTETAIEAARVNGCESVNIDLIYGLPLQTPRRFATTLAKVLQLAPDRIALYNYAHLPTLFKPQRRINEADLPDAATRVELLQLAVRTLRDAGYRYIGMDHFARPDDELARAQELGHLHRNFQGYSTRAEADLLAFGVSAISSIGSTYSQNLKTLPEYYDALDQGVLPLMRGIALNADDLVRRSVIQSLMCHFAVSIEAVEQAYLIKFDKYFAAELEALQSYIRLGLVEIDDGWLCVTSRGRWFVRAICMTFDRYLRQSEERARYSKVV